MTTGERGQHKGTCWLNQDQREGHCLLAGHWDVQHRVGERLEYTKGHWALHQRSAVVWPEDAVINGKVPPIQPNIAPGQRCPGGGLMIDTREHRDGLLGRLRKGDDKERYPEVCYRT